ncbi:MAG: Gfo/Idh/MocA family oxidoreductase [Planctomycetales bacterium]|nr:Gfo/Idh/MocA family oxidoreductase [Planctomycetales bacterium]
MQKLDRRQMLKSSAAAMVAVHTGVPSRVRAASPNERLNIACVGVGGKGWSDMQETSVGQNVVAICDIDAQRLARASEAHPRATAHQDWRKLLEQNNIDAVTVSTPDHMHAPVAMSAAQLGKHLYCQKPLCHSVYEARQLTEIAAANKLVTQMGIQHHSSPKFKTAVKLIRSGIIGKVRAAHVWTDRPGTFWQQAFARPTGQHAVPEHVAWDLWLGVAPARDFVADTYHPFKWRGFWDFGTGALGDMGCHGMDPVVHSLQLGPPNLVRAETSELFPDTGPAWSVITYDFPATPHTATDGFQMVWYDGGKRPDVALFEEADFAGLKWSNGILFLGEHGKLAVDYEHLPHLLPTAKFADTKIEPEPEDNHYQQWVAACKGNGETSTPFSYAGPLTETVLLGNVAIRLQAAIEWDSANLRATNLTAADAFIRRTYRDGWKVKGLS